MVHEQGHTAKIYKERISIKLGDRIFSLSTNVILIFIILIAVTLRLFSAVYQGNDVSNLPGVYDQISYDGLARRVVQGSGFSFEEAHWPATRAGEPTAHWSYLYTLYLAIVYKIFGTYPLVARIIQALIGGAFQTFLVWRIGTRLFNRTIGLIAAAWSAIYIYFFYYAGALVTETFYITGILWTFDASFRIVHEGSRKARWSQWFELSLAIGLTVLLRQLFLLFLPFLFLWIWWNAREVQSNEPGSKNRFKNLWNWPAIKGLIIVTLILSLMIVPWTIRNYRAFGTFVLLNTNAGFAFFWGNHPIHGTNFIPILSSEEEKGYYQLIPTELLSLNEAELDKALLNLGIQFVLDDPGRYVALSISRFVEYFKFWPSPDSGLVSNVSRVGSFGVSLPFILYGLWVAVIKTWQVRPARERWNIALVLLFILVYTSIHLFSWTLIRYRLPLDSFLIVFAALGFQTLVGKIRLLLGNSKADV